jgi:hypothetical protein
MWSLGGTGLILGYMLIVGLFKMMESTSQHATNTTTLSKEEQETTSLVKDDIEKQNYQAIGGTKETS